VEVPALEEVHDAGGDALPFFQHMFSKAAALQAPLAFAASACSIGTFIAGARTTRQPCQLHARVRARAAARADTC
jgi:hypothetical protein